MTKELWKGNEAIAEACVRGGLEAYFGYPITPQTELLEYLSWRMPDLGRAFLQAESELAAINMVYGAAAAGARTMTSSSSPGVSLMQEGLSYIAASNVPMVMVDMMRGGPGLGNLAPTQADYFQLVKGGGHGDYHPIVLAPSSVQEAADMAYASFDLADRYRTIVIIAADGNIGQMMEPVEMPVMREREPRDRGWELTGNVGRPRRVIHSLNLSPVEMAKINALIQDKQRLIGANEVRYAERFAEGCDLLVVAFGSAARIAQTAIRQAREAGLSVGLFRPISLYPFPSERLAALAARTRKMLVFELNAGQMLEDVRLATGSSVPIEFFGRMGGVMPLPDEVLEAIQKAIPAPRTNGVYAPKRVAPIGLN